MTQLNQTKSSILHMTRLYPRGTVDNIIPFLIARGITWSYEELISLVLYLCHVYNSKEFDSSYDIQQQSVHFHMTRLDLL